MHQQPDVHYCSSRDLKSKTSILYICNRCSRTSNTLLSKRETLKGRTTARRNACNIYKRYIRKTTQSKNQTPADTAEYAVSLDQDSHGDRTSYVHTLIRSS